MERQVFQATDEHKEGMLEQPLIQNESWLCGSESLQVGKDRGNSLCILRIKPPKCHIEIYSYHSQIQLFTSVISHSSFNLHLKWDDFVHFSHFNIYPSGGMWAHSKLYQQITKTKLKFFPVTLALWVCLLVRGYLHIGEK